MTTANASVELTEIVFPGHTNDHGTLFAGNALLLMAKAAFLAGRAHAQSDAVMASVGDAQLMAPVPQGSVLRLRAWVGRVGRCSMTVCVSGTAQALGDEASTVLKGIFERVTVDAQGRPEPIAQAYLNQEIA